MHYNSPITLLCGALLTFGVAVRSATGHDAGEQRPLGFGTVTVASGRSFRGEVDPRTDETRLWLRWSHGTIGILRPIDWQRVVQGEFGNGTYSADELRRAAARPTEPAPGARKPDLGQRRVIRVHAGYGNESELREPSPGRAAAGTTDAGPWQTPQVRSLTLDASVGNWDSDVEADGLVVHLRPLDAGGDVVPVEGMLEVTLMGWRSGRTRSRQPPVRLARWTRSVEPADLGPFGIEHHLPFQAVHPEFDLGWAPQGTVHARLSAPGQGVFDVTQSTVRIRRYSAMRDHLEYVSGGRFFPGERTGRGSR